MDRPSRPRAFISYRHIEHETGAAQDTLNAAHRQWVETFAADLRKWQVDAVFDGHLREIFRPYTAQDPFMVPFLAEVSRKAPVPGHSSPDRRPGQRLLRPTQRSATLTREKSRHDYQLRAGRLFAALNQDRGLHGEGALRNRRT